MIIFQVFFPSNLKRVSFNITICRKNLISRLSHKIASHLTSFLFWGEWFLDGDESGNVVKFVRIFGLKTPECIPSLLVFA